MCTRLFVVSRMLSSGCVSVLCFRIRYDQDTSRYILQSSKTSNDTFTILTFYFLIPQGESILLPVFTETDIQMSHRRRIQSRYMSKIHRSCSGCFGCVVALARARVISRVYELVASANAACTERGTLMRIAAMIEAHDRCASGRVCLRVCLCHATQGRHHIKAESTRCYGPNGRIDVRRCAQYLLTP